MCEVVFYVDLFLRLATQRFGTSNEDPVLHRRVALPFAPYPNLFIHTEGEEVSLEGAEIHYHETERRFTVWLPTRRSVKEDVQTYLDTGWKVFPIDNIDELNNL